jgi:hypothetical protein
MNGKVVSLKNTLLNTEDLSTLTEETLFPTKHMQFRGRADDPQAGPSMVETMEGLYQMLDQLLALEADVEEDKIRDFERDVRRLKYGCNVTRFTYLLCLCIFKQATAEEEQELHNLKDMLSKDTESMMGYDRQVRTALDGTWLKDVYKKVFSKDENVTAAGMLI